MVPDSLTAEYISAGETQAAKFEQLAAENLQKIHVFS